MVENLVGSAMARLRGSAVAMMAAAVLMGGCASTDTGAAEVWDPIETPNRFIFAINRTIDLIAIRPLAVTYRDWMPEKGQKGIRNVLDNLGEPVTAINEVVQGSPGRAATTIGRFLVNSTIGIAGIFDVASSIGMPKTKEDAGKTVGYLAGPGVEPENGGFYIVLPLIGPSNARDGVGMAVDAAADPFSIVMFSISSTAGWIATGARYGATAIDARSRTLFALDDLEKNSVDYYAALKSAYTQQRADLIRQKREKTDGKAEIDRRDNLALVR
jgi:phospholipid-binding lipoprotein MlaA